jgi:hypothetical protein
MNGAKMLIIVDNVNERTEKLVPMDDGHAYSVNIPTILID